MSPMDFVVLLVTLILMALVLGNLKKGKSSCANCPNYKTPQKVQINLKNKEPSTKK